MARRNSGDKMSVRLFPELLRCSQRLDSFIQKNTSDNDVRAKEWGRSQARPRDVLREDVNKESLNPRTFPWPSPSYSGKT